MSWIPLHLHSQYSILDSSASIDALVAKAEECGMTSLALTDQGNMYGAVDFYKACKAKKIKAIIGCELYVACGSRLDKKRIPGMPHGFPIVLLAKDKQGYQNLCKLSSLAHLEGFYYTPRIDKELLSKHSEGLICLSGPTQGRVAKLAAEGLEEELLAEVKWYHELFKEDYYFEFLRHQMREEDIHQDGMNKESWLIEQHLAYVKTQEKVIARLKPLADELGIACIAANDTRYIEKGDWKAHEILMNIQSGEPCEIWEKDSQGNPKVRVLNPKRKALSSHEYYFKSPEEMQVLFVDMPESIHNTSIVAEKCYFDFDFKTKFYPVFVPPSLEGQSYTQEARAEEAANFLRELCEIGIKKRYTQDLLEKVQEKHPEKDPIRVVRERLEYELNLIISKGMCDYLLIVYDFIAWAKGQGIPMGPGRGSGAGSIILYLIEITDIEPLRFNLFFERFINPERISYPDIDVDICMDRRSEVIEYTLNKYGKDKVAQIITFGTMKAKMAIKDVGRVLSVPLAKVNAIAKLVPEELNITLEKALEIDPDLRAQYQTDKEVRELIDIAKKLEGCVRNTGIHAAGLIVSADPIMEHIPIAVAKDSEMAVTQFSMKPVEAVGMLKIDFLGLKTLTSIKCAVNAVQKNASVFIDWVNLDLENEATYKLLNQGKTLGLFQLESGGMQDLTRQLHIDKFEEIIAVGALYRPGPMEMIPSFINRKHGREPIDIDHPLMADILSETYGIMVYQEQVMQIASRLANYSLGEGDVLRRAMGKKDHEEMARQREKFRIGALENKIDEETSMRIFDKVEKFASYGFNKSHAAAYGYLSYVTAYFKANYPKEWMAALMTCDRDDITKVAKIIRESQAMGIAVLPPDINESGKEFTATAQGIRFAMTGIKGVGEGVVESVVEERNQKGPFESLYDFIKRIDVRKVGKKVVEHLIESGCFDFTKWSRQALIESVDPIYLTASREQKEAARGILNLFSLMEDQEENRFLIPPQEKEQVSRQKILRRENELLGFYITGHPLDEYRAYLQRLSCVPLSQISEMSHDSVFRSAFIIESVAVKISAKNQRKFAILTIGDGIDRFEVPVWSDLYEEKHHLFIESQVIYAVLQVEKPEGEIKLQCRWLDDLTKVDEAMIVSCDNAFDRAKRQVKMNEYKDKNFPSKRSVEVKKTAPQLSKLVLKIDADCVRFSHILEFKKLFRSSSGTTSVHIEFVNHEGKVGGILIDSKWGIEVTPALEDKLRAFPFLKSINVS
ncbi:MAG: DNA polymerase III subunit alpha [Chlamydiota bacterium]